MRAPRAQRFYADAKTGQVAAVRSESKGQASERVWEVPPCAALGNQDDPFLIDWAEHSYSEPWLPACPSSSSYLCPLIQGDDKLGKSPCSLISLHLRPVLPLVSSVNAQPPAAREISWLET